MYLSLKEREINSIKFKCQFYSGAEHVINIGRFWTDRIKKWVGLDRQTILTKKHFKFDNPNPLKVLNGKNLDEYTVNVDRLDMKQDENNIPVLVLHINEITKK